MTRSARLMSRKQATGSAMSTSKRHPHFGITICMRGQIAKKQDDPLQALSFFYYQAFYKG